MLDIGWTELLVVAVILIVVVGPKDLPPMLRAFGKMTTRLRKTAGEFRAQFDEALREADLEDVSKTISDVRKLNPANAMRDAVNPLRKMGDEIKADLKKATAAPSKPDAEKAEGEGGEAKAAGPLPEMPSPLPPISTDIFKEAAPATLPDAVPAAAPAAAAKPKSTTAAKRAPAKFGTAKRSAAAKSVKVESAADVAAKPAAKSQRTSTAAAEKKPAPVKKPAAASKTKKDLA